MDSKDIELKSALDEIFGDDIIELDNDIPVINKEEKQNENVTINADSEEIVDIIDEPALNMNVNEVKSDAFTNIDSFTIENFIEPTKLELSAIETTLKNDDSVSENTAVFGSDLSESISYNNINEVDNSKTPIENKSDIALESTNNENEQENNSEDKSNIKEEKNIPIAKVIIISILVILLTFASVYFGINFIGNKDKTVICSYVFDDTNYKITDEYKITYQKKKITYIEGTYIYTSKTNEYDEQIKYIKEDKLPAIINSNGMKGFTYTYENTDDSIKISSYLDYTIMDESEIKNIDQKTNPISYFEIDLKENSKNLTDLFEKQGYKCTTSK